MRWRLSKLNWPYAVGELFIVVAGVLIAHAVDQWNSDRLDRVAEIEIIDRFLSDLHEDADAISVGLRILQTKLDLLLQIAPVLEGADPRPSDRTQFLNNVMLSTGYGWAQARARRTTLDDLLGSGRLGLVRDATVRAGISYYYAFDLNLSARIGERETDYPSLAYRLVPRSSEGSLETNLTEAQESRYVGRVLDSALEDHVVGEINFSRFVAERFVRWQNVCLELIDELETYRTSLE